ncbi:MAG: aspartate aminotransferase family protein [Longimicrobiales bacterium]
MAGADARPPLEGDELPQLEGSVPGPRSRALAARLARVESRNITRIADDAPIFWSEARGACVRDADGNTFIDLTAGFGVATAGHANPRVAAAIASQALRLPHALGDVHPADVKVALLERVAGLAPGELRVGILGSAGAEAVEAALKTAVLRTGRPGVLAFRGAYHGLTLGALAVTFRPEFRTPFAARLPAGVRFAPFPAAASDAASAAHREAAALAEVRSILDEAEATAHPIGAVIVEPVQGRGGLVVPTGGFLAGLRELCDGDRRVLIFDEIYTGFGRTGAWFACEHWNVTPDILVAGKALTGSIALSIAIGSPAVMSAWPASSGEAIHTSTFLGNPVACAAALAQIEEIERGGLIARARELGSRIRDRTDHFAATLPGVAEARGIGLLQGVRLITPDGVPDTARALEICARLLRRGILLLAEGDDASVLALTPPAVITFAQLDHALDTIELELRAAAPAASRS